VNPERLRSELKQLIVDECEIDFPPADIDDNEYLLGEAGRLGLDSLDALQIAIAVQKRYGKRIEGGNVNTLADYILA